MPNNSMPLVSVKVLDHQAAEATRQTSSAGVKVKAPIPAGAKSMAEAQGLTTARPTPASVAPTGLADGRVASAARQGPPPTAHGAQRGAEADKIEARTQRKPSAPTNRLDAAAAMAQPHGAGVRAGAPGLGRLISAPLPKRTPAATASAAGRGRAGQARQGGATSMQPATRQRRADEDDPARVRSRPTMGDYAAPGSLAPAIRPAAPAVFGAAITALGHAEASRRAQKAARSPLQAALRAPIADVAHPEVATANIGVQVGGRPPALGAASAGA